MDTPQLPFSYCKPKYWQPVGVVTSISWADMSLSWERQHPTASKPPDREAGWAPPQRPSLSNDPQQTWNLILMWLCLWWLSVAPWSGKMNMMKMKTTTTTMMMTWSVLVRTFSFPPNILISGLGFLCSVTWSDLSPFLFRASRISQSSWLGYCDLVWPNSASKLVSLPMSLKLVITLSSAGRASQMFGFPI